jgi:hypothetical protein
MKILYVAGCGHSGTTLLDLLLSTHSSVCGLGEARMLVNDARRPEYTANANERNCSCGRTINRCPLWSRFLTHVEETPEADFGHRYSTLLSIVQDVTGPDTIVSDSSKYLNPLRQIAEAARSGILQPLISPNDLFAVHLVKDARAWVTSMKDRYDLNRWDLVRWYRKWHRDNQQIRSFLNQENLPSVRVSYEEICFRPRGTLRKIFEAAGIEEHGPVGELGSACVHIGLGNPMRNDDQKSTRIEYDPRWFYEPLIQALYYLVPGVRSYNEQHAEDVMPLYLEKLSVIR